MSVPAAPAGSATIAPFIMADDAEGLIAFLDGVAWADGAAASAEHFVTPELTSIQSSLMQAIDDLRLPAR